MARQSERRTATEQAIIDAAAELFLQDGYSRTTLAAVAERANVAPRTVYLRFDSKVALFQRVIEAGTVGDVDDTPLPQREWAIAAMSAPTLDDRIQAYADGVSEMHERLGPLMAVNNEVEAGEPAVQVSAQAARVATLEFHRAFWMSAARSGLLADGADVDWLITTSTFLSAAETRLLITRTVGWRREDFRDWLVLTWRRLARAAAPVE